MYLNTFRRTARSVKVLSAVAGASAVVAMGAFTAHATGPEAAVTQWDAAPRIAVPTAPSELATPFARPTHTAKPCPKRATMPC